MNRLGEEKSPYLLQHKDNPVDWYPWGEEAFQAARDQNKPIFLSIGYATCYWCHMMEKDSFERQEVADVLNHYFISIKVDREEHPDVDQIYMDAVMGLTGHGGWPMSVFLTPDRKPFFGGTFFWRAQFTELLKKIGEAWGEEPDKLIESGKELTLFLEGNDSAKLVCNIKGGDTQGCQPPDESLLKEALAQLSGSFDAVHGGFGLPPKFPHSMSLSLLLRIHQRTGDEKALAIATKTLEAMASGGIYDRIGGGFHRYATRADWNEPHYEKMLYDNALLSSTYLEAYQVTKGASPNEVSPKNKLYAEVARGTLDYVLKEMTDPEGGFYSAQDAGQVGKEGEYYRLNKEERSRHKPPDKDDKVLTSWNGLMIATMAQGYSILKESRYLEAAQKAARFIEQQLWRDGRLLRRWREGESRFDGTLVDYAFLIHGLLNLDEADADRHWRQWAKELQTKQDELFWDPEGGGYFFSASTETALIVRKKDFNDGATPSGNSIAALNLLRLHNMTDNAAYEKRAAVLLSIFSGLIPRYPASYAQALIAIDRRLNPPSPSSLP
ncbi:MAG: thioredoxin domain-containing protein [Deltaproteobacteria bacterium]|nr:thioredoxin domain-containing protein [Deltaproteobacteria bacterium]